VQHPASRAATVAQLLQHPSRRPALPEYLVDDRLLRRLQVLGGDLVVVDAVDGTCSWLCSRVVALAQLLWPVTES
jgi:hypothetical protein